MGLRTRLARMAADPKFQTWAARFPLTRPFVRREGEAIFELISGFVQSQMLRALVELDVLEAAADPVTAEDLAPQIGLTPERTQLLLRAGVAMGLLRLSRGRFQTTTRGAALTAVPGVRGMILHHDVLYGDLADPVAFLRGQTDPELARFWPYVFGGGAGSVEAARYSRLMADSQTLVAQDALDQVDLGDVRCLMDIGGGSGTFLSHVMARYPDLTGILYDLPEVVATVPPDLSPRITPVSGSFRTGDLPGGADAISLVRVLYDHDDATVRDLLAAARAALPDGGRILIAEPMTGGDRPHTAGDVYFAVYCAAMGTGKARSAREIAAFLSEAGFGHIQAPRPRRGFVTSVVEARA